MPGGNNPLPYQAGGGPTQFERTYYNLRNMVGTGGYCTDEESHEALWRRSKALGLSAVWMDERAVMQGFPNAATDSLPLYEEILALVPSTAATEQDRRALVVERWTNITDSVDDTLRASLQVLDARFALILPVQTVATETHAGRYFQPFDGSEPYSSVGRPATNYPNYSTQYFAYVHLNLGSGMLPTVAEQRTIARAKALLVESLPAWVDFTVFTELGFLLDISRLDQAVFST